MVLKPAAPTRSFPLMSSRFYTLIVSRILSIALLFGVLSAFRKKKPLQNHQFREVTYAQKDFSDC